MTSNLKTVSTNGNGKSGTKVLSAGEIFGGNQASPGGTSALATAVAAAKARETVTAVKPQKEKKKMAVQGGLAELAQKGVIVDEAAGKVFVALDYTVRETAGMFLMSDEYWTTIGKTDVPGIGDDVPVIAQIKLGVKKSAIGLAYNREMRPVRSSSKKGKK